MSLSVNLIDFANTLSTQSKSLKLLINGNAADLSGLTTTAKTNLVAAINEVSSAVAGAGASISDTGTSTLSVWSSTKTNTEIGSQIAATVDSAPALLNTLNELAAALADDPNFATTMTNALALKAPLTSPNLTTPNIGVATATTVNKVTITAPATSATLTLAQGASLTATGTTSVSGSNTGDQTSVTGTSGSTTGNAATATKLSTARAINGVAFDGTAPITVVDSTKADDAATTTALGLKGNISNQTFVTPTIGVATATTVNKVTITAPTTNATLTLAQGTVLSASGVASVSGANTGDQNLSGYATLAAIGDTNVDLVAAFTAGLV